jgi:hypothetical protein
MNRGEQGIEGKQLVFKNAKRIGEGVLSVCQDIAAGNGDETKIKNVISEVNQINSFSISGGFLLGLNDSMINYINKDGADQKKVNSYRSIVVDNLGKMYDDLYIQLESASIFNTFARPFKDYDPACFGIAHQFIAIGRIDDKRIGDLVSRMSKCDDRSKLMKEHYSALEKAGENDNSYKIKAKQVADIYSRMSKSFAEYMKSSST